MQLKPTLGFAVVELLVSLTLFSVVLSITLPALVHSVHELRLTQASEHLGQRANYIASVYKRSLNQSNSLHALGDPKIHPVGVLLKSNGTPFDWANPLRKPDTKSVALSVLIPSSPGLANTVLEASGIRLVCYDASLIPEVQPTTRKHWLGFGPFGAVWMTSKLKLGKASPECPGQKSYRGVFEPILESPFDIPDLGRVGLPDGLTKLLNPELIEHSIHRVVPIEESFSLYLDRSHSLRRFSHTAAENQPIAFDIEQVTLSRTAEIFGNSYFLEIRFIDDLLGPRNYQYPFFVGRSPKANILDLGI